jgi:P-type Cu2+ transporter
VLGSRLATPLGLDRNVWLLLLSLPVLWAARMFFTGAVSALRQRTLDMNVLVALAVGISWLYSVAVTLGLKGELFYDAGAMLATFVLLGHWCRGLRCVADAPRPITGRCLCGGVTYSVDAEPV